MIKRHKQAYQEPVRYMAFYKEDLQFLAGKILSYGFQEHVFSLFGLKTHGNNLVFMLPVSGGPKASRNAANFHDDHEFIMNVSQFLLTDYNLQYIGNLHSHPGFNLACPSSNDQKQIYNVSSKNNIKMLGQIIITYEYYLECENQDPMDLENEEQIQGGIKHAIGAKIRQFCQRPQKEIYVKLNSYIYPDAQSGGYFPMKIKLLEGTNLIREHLSHTELSEFIEMKNEESFPLDRIIIDEYITGQEDTASNLPEVLSEKLLSLPEEILTRSEIVLNPSHLTISSAILGQYIINAKYGVSEDCPLEKLLLVQGHQSLDLTEYIMKSVPNDNMSDVYEEMIKLIKRDFCMGSSKHYKQASVNFYLQEPENCD